MTNLYLYKGLIVKIISFVLNSNPHKQYPLGKTKLYKLLFFADYNYWQTNGETITNDVYLKFPMGPIPYRAWDVITELEKEGVLTIKYSLTTKDNVYTDICLPNSRNVENYTLPREIDVNVTKTLNEYASLNRHELILKSHKVDIWLNALPWQPIAELKGELFEEIKKITNAKDGIKNFISAYKDDIDELSRI